MKNKKRFVKMLLIIVILFVFLFSNNIFAKINSNYVENALASSNEGDDNSLLNIIAEIVLPVILPFFTMVESLTAKVMEMVTDQNFFPWADMIIYNALPVLDINFINPSNGSFFRSISGSDTAIGITVRNIYFSILSICIGFLAIAVAVNVIKLLISDIGSEKAKYKTLINKTIFTVVLLFGMHYLISFTFYLNEQLVIVASNVTQTIIGSDLINNATNTMDEATDEDNEQIVNNFFDDADHTSLSPITIVKKVAKELVNAFSWILDKFSDDSDDDDTATYERDERGNEPFPSKQDYIDKIKSIDHGIDVAAYLLKDYTYRDFKVWSVAGNDSNKFSQGGIWGTLTSVSNTVMWVTGLVDTGLLGLQNLYNDVYFVCVTMKEHNIITSAKDYSDSADYYIDIINDTSKSEDERNNARINLLYLNAHFRYVYEGEDKQEVGAKAIISSIGNYFKANIYYTDVDAGDWSPNKFNVVPCILYCVFIIQSMMFLFSYAKRFFYVIILALIGPIVVVYDYIFLSL